MPAPPIPAQAPPRAPSRGFALLPSALLAGTSTVLLVALAAFGPVVPLAVLGALLAVLTATFRPKAFALIALVAIVVEAPLRNVLGPVGGYAGEGAIALAAVALSTRRLVTEGRLVWLPGTGWFAGYLVIGLLSSVAAEVPADITLPASYVALKGVIFAFALAQLDWTREDLVVLVRVGITAIVVMATTGLVNLVFPATWTGLTTGNPPLSYVGPIPALNGVFQHPAAFSRFCGVLAVGALVYGLVVRRSFANGVLLVASGGFALLSFQVKSIVGLLGTLAVLGGRYLRPVGAAAVVAVAPLVLLVAAPPVVSLVSGDITMYVDPDSARFRLVQGGATVAAEYFPLGAGFGRYGSSTAAENYSPLYYDLGFPDRYGLTPEPDSGQFLNDSQWPAIYGETGWIGAFFFAAGLACMLVSLLRRTTVAEQPLVHWIRITGVGWLFLLLVESVASPVFVSSPSFPFVFAAAGIVAAFRATGQDGRPGRHRLSSPHG
ncbi:hypothetical protein [Candidatus Blastococcus massiliensis]|uniref:hypothetical protein n=1 Tax=Candidatus Blastococcus massiliensis TaxID=1470358 RepID=UPI0004AD72C7|nr:hypothetical protein [Candidatus Blastococcus massiliensis]